MYNSNTDSLGLIMDVEDFFFSGSLFRSTVNALLSVGDNWTMVTEHDIVQLATQFL